MTKGNDIASHVLPLGSVNVGDVLTFGGDPMRWIADEVSESESGIVAISIRPEDKP